MTTEPVSAADARQLGLATDPMPLRAITTPRTVTAVTGCDCGDAYGIHHEVSTDA